MTITGPFGLPFENGAIKVDWRGAVKLGERNTAYPWAELPCFYTDITRNEWQRFTTRGQEMLIGLGLNRPNVSIRTGYYLLAALLMSAPPNWLTVLANMKKHREDGHDGMLYVTGATEQFGVGPSSRLFFSDGLYDKLEFEQLPPPNERDRP